MTGQSSAIASLFVLKTLIKSFLNARRPLHQVKTERYFGLYFFCLFDGLHPDNDGTELSYRFTLRAKNSYQEFS